MTTLDILKTAKAASARLAVLDTETKNRALIAMADALERNADKILLANTQDLEAARGTMGEVMLDRLMLTAERIHAMSMGIRQVAKLPDPVGQVTNSVTRQNGLVIEKTRVPMGVVAIIYESRPNVTSDAAALALKSGNVSVLRGGKEAYKTSYAIVEALKSGLESVGVSPDFVNMLEDTTREGANELMRASEYVDLLIPRGGAGLIRACVENAKVPCIHTGTGICHVYVDEQAHIPMALRIIENAKTSRPSVCNAMEVLLVHEGIAGKLLPKLYQHLVTDRIKKGKVPVEMVLDDRAMQIIPGIPAGESDYDTEFLDYKMAVKTVGSVEEAVNHIAKHSTHHSEAIITKSTENAAYFTAAVDSAAVYVNASTRFTDGGEFGLGCEIGISTQKLHARGPMGLEEMTTYKYIIKGNGQIR